MAQPEEDMAALEESIDLLLSLESKVSSTMYIV